MNSQNESGLDVEEIRCRAYYEIWVNLRFLYGNKGFEDFQAFCKWLDETFKEK